MRTYDNGAEIAGLVRAAREAFGPAAPDALEAAARQARAAQCGSCSSWRGAFADARRAVEGMPDDRRAAMMAGAEPGDAPSDGV